MASPQSAATPRVNAAAQQNTAGVVNGKTVIEDAVVAKVAGIAVREIPGVFALGGGVARMIGSVRDAVGNTDLTQGVAVEVGETQVAADISVVAEYPVALQDLSNKIRTAVARAITELVGMEISEVNVTISDVHVASEEDNRPEAEARVQ
ncbi:Asp23/Gls24 family envelope stress response protein [Humidisolicoccus flavus]|uniref:Asp23/Gls24 family envelope stress response protein n=1 Tax=Humidisolicoccus flavus TaxID=3111414 RepID=UPI00324FB0BF